MNDVKTFKRKPWETEGITWNGTNTEQVVKFAKSHSYVAVHNESVDEIKCTGNGGSICVNMYDTLMSKGEELLEAIDECTIEEDFEVMDE